MQQRCEFALLQQLPSQFGNAYADINNDALLLHGEGAAKLNDCFWRHLHWHPSFPLHTDDAGALRHMTINAALAPRVMSVSEWEEDRLGPRPTWWCKIAGWDIPGATLWKAMCDDASDGNYGKLLIVRPIVTLVLQLDVSLYTNREAQFPIRVGRYGYLRISRETKDPDGNPLLKLTTSSRRPFNILASLSLLSGATFAHVVCHRHDRLHDLLGQVLQYKAVSYHRPVLVTFGDHRFHYEAGAREPQTTLMMFVWFNKFGDASALYRTRNTKKKRTWSAFARSVIPRTR